MFEHLDKVPFWHHSFIISSSKECLLCLESCPLIKWIVELRESISYLTSCDNWLKAFYTTWIGTASLGKRRDNFWMIYEKRRPSNLFTNVFPESICESFSIVSFVFDPQFLELVSHLLVCCSEEIDTCF